LIWGFSPTLWNSDRKPSSKMRVGMLGPVDDDATAVEVAAAAGALAS
jgi:hypothetical protein